MYVSAFVSQIRLCFVLSSGVVASAPTPCPTLRFCNSDMLSSAVRYLNQQTVQSSCESSVRSTVSTQLLIYRQQTRDIWRWVGYDCGHAGSCTMPTCAQSSPAAVPACGTRRGCVCMYLFINIRPTRNAHGGAFALPRAAATSHAAITCLDRP